MSPRPDDDWDAPVAPSPTVGTADWDSEDWDAPAKSAAPIPPAGASAHLASTADFSGKPPVMSGAFRPSLGPPDRGGASLRDVGEFLGGAVGGGIVDVADRYVGKIGEAAQAGLNALLPAGAKWDFGDPEDTARPVSAAADMINRALGTGAPTVAQTKESLRRSNPNVAAGFEAEETAAPYVADTALMLTGGGKIGTVLGRTKVGGALATTRVGRGLLGATSFGGANVLTDPTHPVQAVTNGALAYAGMKAGEFVASPFLGRLLATAGESAKANPLFVKALAGVAEGAGQSLAPQRHDGEWRSALLAGDWKDVAVNVALNAIFQAGAPDIPQGVKEAYIKGRAGEVPPEYMARLNTLAGPIYDTGRRLAGEARKAEAGAKPWTAADEMAAREKIRQGGATGKAAEAQLAKAKRDTYDADLVTADVLAGGKTGTVNEAVDTVLGQDRTDFARESARKAELAAGPRETQALEMTEAAAEGQATREAAKAAVEPGDPAMLSRPIGGPDNWDLPVAPPAAPGAPAESAPSLALIGKTKDGRAVYGRGDSFYVRGTGGRLGAAHPKDVAEAQGTPEAPAARAPRLKSADTLQVEGEGKSLSQFVRAQGGIAFDQVAGLRGEMNMLSQKEAGTSGVLRRNGGKSLEDMMASARESGFDIPHDMAPAEFLQRLLEDVQGVKTLNPAEVDAEKLGAAALRREAEAGLARLSELPPEERARVEAETQERIRQDLADLEMERAEREAVQAEARGELNDADTSFDFGANVTGTTREGEMVAGQVVRETGRSTIVDTPDGQRSIPKGKAAKEPRGVYLGSGLGGIQPMIESTGPAIETAAKGIARASRGFADWLRMRTVPNMTRSSPEAGSYAGGIINGTTTSSLVAPVWIERVFGENPSAETLAKFGHAAGEWQFRSRKQQLEAELASATDDVARARIKDKLDRVGTVVGADGSPFQTKAEMDAYLDSPEFKAMAEKWREQWNRANIVDGDLLPGPERMYQDLTKRGEADPDLFTSDPRDFLRVNMKPMEPDEAGGTRPVYRTATGSLRSPMLRGHAFSREFTGAAEKYDFDPAALVQNTYQRVHREWLKPKMYAAMERAGDAMRTNLSDPEWKPPTKIKGEDVEVFPITPSRTYLRDGKSFTVPGENLYVRKSLAPEVKQTLRVNTPARGPFVFRALNTAALTGIADNVWNLMLDSMIPASAPGHIPGKVGLQAGIANNLVGMFKQLKYTLRRPEGYNETRLRLAADASWRGARGQEWTPEYVKGRLAEMANPLKIPGVAAEAVVGGLGRLAQRVHEAGRIVLDEAYTNLVKAGLVKETPTSRREFINRVGQYAGRAMGPKTEMLRDTGVQPFIVAKKKSAGEIARKLTFSPGTKAANMSASVQLRVGQVMRLFTLLGVIGAVNYWKTGSPTGRPGTPLGNIDLGGDDQKTGAPQSLAILGDLTGWGPALRASGATGAFGAKQQGLTDAQAIGEASKGPLNAFVYKWLSSPVLDFASRVATGKTIPQNMGGGGGPSAEPAQPGENAIANRVGFAARQAAQLGPVVTQGIDKVLGTGLTPDYAPDATNEFLDLLKTFAPKRGIRPEIMAAMPDIKNRASAAEWTEWAARQRSNMNPDEWWAWVQKTVGQSNWPSRERSSTLETLSRKRGK